MPLFAHDGIQFHYEAKGSGLPCFFQHGLGADVSQPFGLLTPPSGIRLLAFDCRAHGRTQPAGPAAKIGIGAFADDLRALMDFLKIERCIVGGISMGAAVALNFALRYPDRVIGLILSRPAWLDGPNPWNVRMFTVIARLLREHGPARGRELFKQTPEFAETAREFPDVARSLGGQFENPRAAENVVNLERIPLDAPCQDRREWASIKTPALVLANRQDPVHPFEYGEICARLIPGAEFQEIAAKSVSVEQHALDVQRFIEDFLKRRFL